MSLSLTTTLPKEEQEILIQTRLDIPLGVKRAIQDIDPRLIGQKVPANYPEKLSWADYSRDHTHGELDVYGPVDGIFCIKAIFIIQIRNSRHMVGRIRDARGGGGWRDSTPEDLEAYLKEGQNRTWAHLHYY